jgi:hypothetical protein
VNGLISACSVCALLESRAVASCAPLQQIVASCSRLLRGLHKTAAGSYCPCF